MDNKDRNNFRNKNNNRDREVANVEFADELIDLDEIDKKTMKKETIKTEIVVGKCKKVKNLYQT